MHLMQHQLHTLNATTAMHLYVIYYFIQAIHLLILLSNLLCNVEFFYRMQFYPHYSNSHFTMCSFRNMQLFLVTFLLEHVDQCLIAVLKYFIFLEFDYVTNMLVQFNSFLKRMQCLQQLLCNRQSITSLFLSNARRHLMQTIIKH